MTETERSRQLAKAAHESIGQMRKYGGQPYYLHLWAISELVAQKTSSEDVICAAALHDVLEDVAPKRPEFGREWIRQEFGQKVLDLVIEVTNVYTSVKFPDMSKKERKAAEAVRLAGISEDAKIIKRADLYHNATEMEFAPEEFRVRWLAEKAVLDGLIGRYEDG
jgi:(p)ppGpp synthase/HD superfamily hydrolase